MKELWNGGWEGIWSLKIRDRNTKKVKAFYPELHNALVDEGEDNVLDTYFRGQNAPTQFYVGLGQGSVSEDDSLVDLPGEPSGNGYARQLIERSVVGWPTLLQNEGDFRAVSKELTFSASGGDIGPVNYAFLATSLDNTGKLISFVSLPLERTILDGDEAILNIRIKLK